MVNHGSCHSRLVWVVGVLSEVHPTAQAAVEEICFMHHNGAAQINSGKI